MASPTDLHEQSARSASPDQHDFSVLSQQSLGDDVSTHGGDVDKHPKGKRKRTAAKDKMILEEAYRSNPKPDKQARQEIVARVSLNEKGVQIWFQNRRQNDRRKSRPLSTEELAALRFGGMHHASSDPTSSRGAMASMEPGDRSFSSSDPSSSSRPVDQEPASPRPSYATSRLTRSFSDVVAAVATPKPHATSPPQTQSQEVPSWKESEHTPQFLSHSFSGPVGYLANRWNLGSSFSTPSTLDRGGHDSLRLGRFPPSSCSSDKTYNKSEPQSQVRLSLSLEGKAELVSGQTSPSRPPTSRTPPALFSSSVAPRPRAGLSRSHSALPSITLPPISTVTSSIPPRLARGRSRDVQAWESCAESERRDELTAQAEHESSGSAIAAISLLRSTSGILQPSSAKRNASLSRPRLQPHPPRQAKRAKLGRASSTFASLETTAPLDSHPKKQDSNREKQRGTDLDGKAKVTSMLVSPTDSDKENWSPDEEDEDEDEDEDGDEDGSHRRHEGGAPRRRRLPATSRSCSINPRRRGRVLRDHSPTPGSRCHIAPSRPTGSYKPASSTIAIFEDQRSPPRRKRHFREDDVERFMRGEVVSPSKRPDMDCVAGLLSLSQGAWR
ncbi:hypothetical protein E4U42_006617 [Claviceps africana]|uniref:Homeobox domain-containing protein n=1 Tax=Claviceps africana TaxID=83212 RepID=A0A8K0NGL1_9HYPO|nr:hypothetical protein E4U42_006617 [Claviceps africana]